MKNGNMRPSESAFTAWQRSNGAKCKRNASLFMAFAWTTGRRVLVCTSDRVLGMKPTHWILIGLTVGLVTFDVVVSTTDWMPTISEVIWDWCRGNPVVPFAGGVLCGHWFWQK